MFEQLKNINLNEIGNLLVYDGNPMLFNTGLFLLLFLLFIGLYQLTKRSFKYNSILVILFSFYFYYKSSEYYCLMLLAICFSDYTIGRILGVATQPILRKLCVAFSVLSNISILICFKYFNLLLSTISDLVNTSFEPLNIILPAGISFITFRSMSYIIDIYRNDIVPERNIINYIFFLSFFPPLLAGPVVRAKDMLPQIRANQPATKQMIGEGFFLIMCGLIKKVVIADYIGVNFIDRIFDNPALYSGFENIIGVIGYSLQIYCDFSGYSDMAIGLALIMGYKFKDNFNAPYKSQNPSEFWRRWHISLSTWLKDYIYIPLGGNRNTSIGSYIWLLLLTIPIIGAAVYLVLDFESGYLSPILGVILSVWILYIIVSLIKVPARRKGIITSMHLLVTMLIGGIWHGASWMFALWGAWTGLLLILHKQLKKIYHLSDKQRVQMWRRIANVFVTFILMSISWIFFRSSSLDVVSDMMSQITQDFTGNQRHFISLFINSYPFIFALILLGYIMHYAPKKWTVTLCDKFTNLPALVKSMIFAIILFIVIQSRQSEIVPFIYQQF